MKRVVGETVVVTADIYADGHEVVATKILYRKRGDREWNTAPMHALENDRWTGTFVADQAGIYHYRLCAHGTLASLTPGTPHDVREQADDKEHEKNKEKDAASPG